MCPAARGVGDHAATIRNWPGRKPMPVITPRIAAIVVVAGVAKKETKRGAVEIRVSPIRVIVRVEGERVGNVVGVRIWRRSRSRMNHYRLGRYLSRRIIGGLHEAERVGRVVRFNRRRGGNFEG